MLVGLVVSGWLGKYLLMGVLVAIWDKIKKEYIKLCGWGVKSKFHHRQTFTEDDIKRFIKTRKKRGQRVE